MRRCIRLLATLLVLQGCCPKLYPSSTESIERTEVVKEIIRDTVIQVQPDSSILQALIQCDSTGRARLQEINSLKESARLQQSIQMEPEPLPYQPTAIPRFNKIGFPTFPISFNKSKFCILRAPI